MWGTSEGRLCAGSEGVNGLRKGWCSTPWAAAAERLGSQCRAAERAVVPVTSSKNRTSTSAPSSCWTAAAKSRPRSFQSWWATTLGHWCELLVRVSVYSRAQSASRDRRPADRGRLVGFQLGAVGPKRERVVIGHHPDPSPWQSVPLDIQTSVKDRGREVLGPEVRYRRCWRGCGDCPGPPTCSQGGAPRRSVMPAPPSATGGGLPQGQARLCPGRRASAAELAVASWRTAQSIG